MMAFGTILVDPPWPQGLSGKWAKHKAAEALPYPTMTLEALAALPVRKLAAPGCHLWLWTTNQTLRAGFDLLEAWDFTYLAPVHWIKPSGFGNWFIHRTQTLLFGYFQQCRFPQARFLPNMFNANPARHSRKPSESYELIEAVSPGPRLEMFARPPVRDGWQALGNEVDGLSIEEGIKVLLLQKQNGITRPKDGTI